MRLRGGDRKYCIAGNWKMNPATLDDAKKLANEVLGPKTPWLRHVASCPPALPSPRASRIRAWCAARDGRVRVASVCFWTSSAPCLPAAVQGSCLASTLFSGAAER